jgi:hypothetical protein
LQVFCTCKISALNEKCTIGMLPREMRCWVHPTYG